jgi:transcriptional regulator with XRE-family HTH domain
MLASPDAGIEAGRLESPVVASQGGSSQEALAIDAGIDPTHVSRMDRGLENPSAGVLERIADVIRSELVEFSGCLLPASKRRNRYAVAAGVAATRRCGRV